MRTHIVLFLRPVTISFSFFILTFRQNVVKSCTPIWIFTTITTIFCTLLVRPKSWLFNWHSASDDRIRKGQKRKKGQVHLCKLCFLTINFPPIKLVSVLKTHQAIHRNIFGTLTQPPFVLISRCGGLISSSGSLGHEQRWRRISGQAEKFQVGWQKLSFKNATILNLLMCMT